MAQYVLESGFGNPNPCISTVSGIYTAGTPLSADNTVSIRVTILTPGNFTIATDTANGMMFSSIGTFATAGAEDVILKGSGTPVMIGTFSYIPTIVGPAPFGGATCAIGIKVK